MDFRLVDDSDPGDETQRNFRYQHAYGVILLIAAGRGEKPYHNLWCEYHEDFLGEHQDGLLDAYQIKTRRPEAGLWSLRDEHLRKSIKRFVGLFRLFGDRIKNYYFVSNADFPKPEQYINNPSRFAQNPTAFINAIQRTDSKAEIAQPFIDTFDEILSSCDCGEDELLIVLKRLLIIKGPSREGFDAEIAHEHLPELIECSALRPQDLNYIRDELILRFFHASSLFIEDPDRHITPININTIITPEVEAKRIPVSLLFETIEEAKLRAKNEPLTDIRNNCGKNLIFICHSSPGDDEFSKWLTFQLVNAGFSVWCDLIHLQPGAEYETTVKDIIQTRTGKFLFIVSNGTNVHSRALEQLQIAYDRMRTEGLDNFIIPVELKPDVPEIFLLKKIAPISFIDNWAHGIRQLLRSLNSSGVMFAKKNDGPSVSNLIWRSLLDPEQGVYSAKEEYLSNWFKIEELPQNIYFHKLKKAGGGLGSIQLSTTLPIPGFQHNIYLVSFGEAADFQGLLGTLEIYETNEIPTHNFLEGDYDHQLVKPNHAKSFLVRLLNQGWEFYIPHSRLLPYQMANGKICYYYHQGFGDSMVPFIGINQKKSRRSLWGYKTVLTKDGSKTKKYWHFGITAKPIANPEFAFVIKSHVLFSDDGTNVWISKNRLHSARRSWCSGWWNPHWRDRLLAMITFLSNDQAAFEIPLGSNAKVRVNSSPITYISPVSYYGPKDKPVEDDDAGDENEVLDIDLSEDYSFDEESEVRDE